MIRIVFVDDEQNVLDGLRRMLRSLRSEWDMTFVSNPLDVMPLMDEEPFDVIVSDMRMPEMDGLHLLEQVKLHHPETVRIILSGQFESANSIGLIGVAHQFLAKPCDADELRDVIVRAAELRSRLDNEGLLRLISGISSLPSPPARFAELMRLVQSEDSSLAEIAAVIAEDTGMTAKVLQLVNSSFFGLRRKVTDPAQAVSLLGLENLVALALGAHIFTRMGKAAEAGLNLDREHDRSVAVAAGAEAIALAAGLKESDASAYYLAGMLHDAGRLVLASNFARRYVHAAQVTPAEVIGVERTEFGASHEEVGAYLLGVWGLPDEVVEAAAFHHEPSLSSVTTLAPLTAVHIAQAIIDAGDSPPVYDDDYLAACGTPADLQDWKAAAYRVMVTALEEESA